MTRPNAVIAVLAVLTLCGCGATDTPVPPAAARAQSDAGAFADISRRVRQRAGANLIECGVWLDGDGTVPAGALTQALVCGRAAAAKGQPFWIAMHAPGGVNFHEVHAQGLFAGTDGVIQRFSYTVDLRMSGGPGPDFATWPCEAPTETGAPNTLRCSGERAR